MTSALENIKSIDLEQWLTLATAPAPTKLKQGQTPDMQNVWTDEKPGSIITAPGYTKVGTTPSGNPTSFIINYFKTSSGVQTFVASDNSTVWTTVDFQTWTPIITGLSSSFQLRGAVIRDKLWLTNGSDSVRTFDGSAVVVLDGSGSTPDVPKGRYITYHDERVWIYHVSSNRSAVYFSSLTDASANIIDPDNVAAWDTTDNFLQISEGDADFGTGMILYRGYLHFFKQYSIWRLVGYDEYTYSRVKTRASTGTRFQESVQILDSLVHLIGVDGIYVFDGEESVRISDIIDPATASQTAFGFNQLQQPNTNNQFWESSSTLDWEAGTVPADIAVDNAITLQAADDTQADFQAGPTQTNLDLVTNPGFIQLAVSNGGASSVNIARGLPCSINSPSGGGGAVGSGNQLTDGNLSAIAGYTAGNFSANGSVVISGIPSINITKIIIRQLSPSTIGFVDQDGTAIVVSSVSAVGGGWFSGHPLQQNMIQASTANTPRDVTILFSSFQISSIKIGMFGVQGAAPLLCSEIEIYTAAYNSTGQFISKTLDLGLTPVTVEDFNASEILNGEGTSYFTQSSDDGVAWDASVACTNGGFIGSALKRYLRWGVNLTSDGLNTPQIDSVFLPAVYISAIHDTGGNIFAWGPLESDYSLAGQRAIFYYRGATISGSIVTTAWSVIAPGGVLNQSTSFRFIQFKIEISGGSASNLPSVNSVTINWVVGTGTQPQTLQNVASVYWRNRYWLSAAGPSATQNNLILIRGKKTFESPWMLKDWPFLSFARYYDSLYGGSSIDGSIHQLDSGYSKAGVAMNSYFETQDFTFGGFTAQVVELLVEAERTGPWNLNIGVSVDGGNTFDTYIMDLTPSTYDNEYMKRIHVNYTTTRIRLRFGTNGVDTPFQVHRCIMFYSLSGARGSIRGDYM